MCRTFCMLDIFLFFGDCTWLLPFGALGLLPAWGKRLLPLALWVVGCVCVYLLVFVFWRSGVFVSFSFWWLRLPFVPWPVASVLSGLFLFFSWVFPSFPFLGFLLCLSVFSDFLPASLAWYLVFPCEWPGRPDLISCCSCYCSFFFLLLVGVVFLFLVLVCFCLFCILFCTQLCWVGAGDGCGGGAPVC